MASARLTKTISSSTGKIFTLSVWLKKADNAAISTIFHLTSDSNTNKYIEIASKSGYGIDFQLKNGTSGTNGTYLRRRTTRVLRDLSAWYHIVIRFDSTNSTASDRARIYINGEQATDIDQDGTPDVPLNFVSDLNNASSNLSLAGFVGGSNYLNGQLAHFHFTDGYSYAPTEFGETDATTGIWKPKTSPSVTYGTNGFFLRFDNSANMGLDSSGQSNNFTTNGTIIQAKDTPTNVFATLNPLNVPTSNAPTFSNVNSKGTSNSSGKFIGSSTIGVSSGKWYMEVKVTEQSGSNSYIGVADEIGTIENARNNGNGYGNGILYRTNGQYRTSTNGSTTDVNYGNSYAQGDIIGIALNCDDNEIVFYKNGTAQNSGTAISIPTPDGFLFLNISLGSAAEESFEVNFGNGYFGTTAVTSAQNPDDGIGIFEYDVPAGYRALCTKSINAEEYS